MSQYLVDIKLSNKDLEYINKIVKFATSSTCSRNELLDMVFIEKNLLKNEYYVIFYYIEFMNSVKNLHRIDLQVIKDLITRDKHVFVDSPHIDVRKEFAVGSNDAMADVIEQVVCDRVDEIKEMEEVTKEEFDLSIQVLKKLVKELQVQNMIYVSSKIFFEGHKIGRKEFKGRDGYVEFMRKGINDINSLENDNKLMRVNRENIYKQSSSREPLFKHPLPILQNSWGDVCSGDCISVLAVQNVGKSTISFNYIAEALIAKVNTGLLISEMAMLGVIARTISIIAARKYEMKLPTTPVEHYLSIDKKRQSVANYTLTEAEKMFLGKNEQLINNTEFILNHIFSNSNDELGSLYIIETMYVEDIDMDFEKYRNEENIQFIVADHVNGLKSRTPMKDHERLNKGYIDFNGSGKRFGITTLITNHILDSTKDSKLDKNADIVTVRGKNSSESTNSPDKVIILDSSMEMKARGEFTIETNKDRNTSVFFDKTLVRFVKEIGYIYEPELD